MAAVKINLNQAAKPAGTAGFAREDLATGVKVVASAAGGPYLSYQWTLADVAMDVVAGVVSTAHLTTPQLAQTDVENINLPGTYRLSLMVDSGLGLGHGADDVASLTFYAGPALSVDPEALPRREPAFGETTEHNVPSALFPTGNPLGWKLELARWFAVIRKLRNDVTSLVLSVLTGPSNVLFVDLAGDDNTAVRGDSSHPYRTLTAALAAAQSGDVVQIGPGYFSEPAPVTLPELARISVIGAGRDLTTIYFGAGSGDAAFNVAPQTVSLESCTLADFSIYNDAALGFAFSISGATKPIDSLHMRNVGWSTDSGAGGEIQRVGIANIVNCKGDSLALYGVQNASVDATRSDEGVTVQWIDSDTAAWGFGDNKTEVAGCTLDGLKVKGAAVVTAVGSDLGYAQVLFGLDSTVQGTLTAAGCVLSGLVVDALGTAGGPGVSAAVADACKIDAIGVTRASGVGRVSVSARGGAIAGAVSAGDGCDVDIRGSSFVQASLTKTGTGTVERSRHRQAISLINGNKNVAFAVPFTTPYYSTTIEVWASGTDARVNDAVASDITIASNAIDTNASFILIHD